MASKKNSGKSRSQAKASKNAAANSASAAVDKKAVKTPVVEDLAPVEEFDPSVKPAVPEEQVAEELAQPATAVPAVEELAPVEEFDPAAKPAISEDQIAEELTKPASEVPAEEDLAPVEEFDPSAKAAVPEEQVERDLKQTAAESAPARKVKGMPFINGKPRLPGGITPRPEFTGDPYLPHLATVVEIIEETSNIRTLRLVLDNDEEKKAFTFEPGQVGQISVFGAGEATFVINSPPSQKDYLQFSVMKAGEVTDAIHKLDTGAKVGLRAPLGNYFPYRQWHGKNVFFIGGGIGMAPIRTIMLYLLEHKQDYGKISLLYGARSPKDMAYSYELDAWKHNPDLDCTLCIDNPYENWDHKVGLIPKVLEEINPSPENTVAVLCGPPIMIKFTLQSLQKMGFEPQNIVTTLEKRMKCGIGICGRCNIGDKYVCVDGPVFTLKELDGLPPDL